MPQKLRFKFHKAELCRQAFPNRIGERDKILEQSEYVSDDEYLRSIDGMVQSIQQARAEPTENGVTLDKLDWW
jgi:hypothetical protein